MSRPQCILCVMLSWYCSQSSRRSKLRCEENPSCLRSGVIVCAWCSCFAISSKQRGPEIGFSICLLLLQHRTSSQWIDPTIPGGFWFYLAEWISCMGLILTSTRNSSQRTIPSAGQPSHFAHMWTDMAIVQSINLHSKTTSGITGISQRPGALD